MAKLFQLMSKFEGFGIAGTVPTRNNNPLDLRHSPHSDHLPGNPDGIGIIDTLEHGIEDGERQLRLFAERGFTIREMIMIFAPSNENNTPEYLNFICSNLNLPPETLVSIALEIPA